MTLVIGFAYLVTRILATTFIAPLLGHKSVSLMIRVSLAILIALIIAPNVLPDFVAQANTEIASTAVASQCLNEALIGTSIGLGMLIIFSAAMMIGTAIGQLSGLQMESVFGSEAGFGQHPATQLIGLTAASVFILSGGLELSLATIMNTFGQLPIGNTIPPEKALQMITTILSQSFELTIRAVAPAVAALLVSTILIGVVSRTLPQLNLFQVGFSTNIGLMLTAAFLTLSGCVWLVIDEYEQVNELIRNSLATINQDPQP